MHLTIRRWRNKCHTGKEFVKDVTKLGRPVTATDKTNISKVREII